MSKKPKSDISRVKSAMEEFKTELSNELGLDEKSVIRDEILSKDGKRIARNMSLRAKKIEGSIKRGYKFDLPLKIVP